MNRITNVRAALLVSVASVFSINLGAKAQEPGPGRRDPERPAVAASVLSDSQPPSEWPNRLDPVWRRPVLRVGGDYKLGPGDAVRSVAVIYGDATIDGRVDRDVLVVFGTAELWSTANIEGSLTVVGGAAIVSPGATVGRDLVVVASALHAPAEFAPGGESIVIGSKAFGGAVEAIVPWITRGLLWGRPFVPSLPWVWIVALIFFVLYLALNLIFDNAVRACAETLTVRPLTSFGAGILVLLLVGPVCVLLAVSIIGIAIIPFVICAVVAAWILGRARGVSLDWDERHSAGVTRKPAGIDAILRHRVRADCWPTCFRSWA